MEKRYTRLFHAWFVSVAWTTFLMSPFAIKYPGPVTAIVAVYAICIGFNLWLMSAPKSIVTKGWLDNIWS